MVEDDALMQESNSTPESPQSLSRLKKQSGTVEDSMEVISELILEIQYSESLSIESPSHAPTLTLSSLQTSRKETFSVLPWGSLSRPNPAMLFLPTTLSLNSRNSFMLSSVLIKSLYVQSGMTVERSSHHVSSGGSAPFKAWWSWINSSSIFCNCSVAFFAVNRYFSNLISSAVKSSSKQV